MKDEEILEGCRDGASGAWSRLIDRFGASVWTAIRGVLRSRAAGADDDLAREVFQEVFCELWARSALDRLRRARDLRPFLIGLGVCRALDAVRRLRRDTRLRHLPAAGTARQDPGPEAALTARELGEALADLTGGLPPRDAYILRLSLEEDLTHREIAEHMGLNADTVSTILRRSRLKIRDGLKERGLWNE